MYQLYTNLNQPGIDDTRSLQRIMGSLSKGVDGIHTYNEQDMEELRLSLKQLVKEMYAFKINRD
jgi:hypothetical protein